MFKNKLNVPNNSYNHVNRDKEDNQTEYFTKEKKTPAFSEFSQVPNYVKEAIYLTVGGSTISDMSNMVLNTEKNYRNAEKMWNYCSDDTGAFPKLNNMEKMISRV